MTTADEVRARFRDLTFDDNRSLGSWLSDRGNPLVADRIARVHDEPLSKVQLNQLLVMSEEASISDGFFRYYWLEKPLHPYDVTSIPPFARALDAALEKGAIVSLDHLEWGIRRLYTDGLLFFGHILAAFRYLRSLQYEELSRFFVAKRFDTDAIAGRGPALPLKEIARDTRYLISEMACKSLERLPSGESQMSLFLDQSWKEHEESGSGSTTIRDLLSPDKIEKYAGNQMELEFAADEILDERVSSKAEMDARVSRVSAAFDAARASALMNTELYLSVVNDLDVYVATSMRNRDDFRRMAEACDTIFRHKKVKDLHLRYFDPTMSAAEGHEDKGLIECLMVKCAKVLVYCAGAKESFGKDAEAAMALSLGKPVVFYCDTGQRMDFYRKVHPLSRLIDFSSGVAVGAMVTDKADEVAELLRRIFANEMEYDLELHPSRERFLRLKERLTASIVRLQTDDRLLTTTFWNNYHNRERYSGRSLMTGKELERRLE